MTVAAILRQKGPAVAHVPATATVAEVVHMLAHKRIGAVLVMEGDRLLGILSERDIVRCLARQGASALDHAAESLMTREVQTATRDTTVAEAMEMMTDGRFRHVPVVEGDRVVGVVSIGDVVKARIDQQAHEVDSLKAYVAGN